jgi:hypothetical protein
VDGLGPGSGGVSPAEPGACLDLGALGPTSFETPKVPVAGEGSQNSLRGPAEDDPRAHRSRTDRKLQLDVYGHTLDWRENEEAAQKLGDSIAKAVADSERNSDNSDCLTATKEKSFHSQKMEVF